MEAVDLKKKLFIDGKWREAEQHAPLYSPFTEQKLAEIPQATEAEIEAALAAAEQAREVLRKAPAHQRATWLEKIARYIEEHAEEAAKIIAAEAAKPLKIARGEIARTVQTYKFAAEEAKRIGGETIPLDAAPGGENRLAYTVREPVGVVAAITPFNFPFNLVAHKVGPALAAGNPVVLKPASQTPLSAFFLAEAAEYAGVPAGALNVITGKGSTVGNKLVTDDRVQVITFTGSPAVGIGLRNKAGLKRVTLELGSNSGVYIDKGVDLDPIMDRIVTGAFSNQGQVCISVQRIYVHEAQFDEFVAKFVRATEALKIGDALDEDTDISALISPGDVSRSIEWIQEAVESGAEIATGGTAVGNVLHPTVILNANPILKVCCQEVFAPIVLINKVESADEAIELLNDSRYGLQAGFYTNDINTALDAADRLHVGGVMINDIPTYRVDHMPYGGVKESGFGREGVKYAIEEMTEMKLVVINRN